MPTVVDFSQCEVPELEEANPDLGTEAPRRFAAEIANQPIAVRLRDLHAVHGLPTPPECALYERFELWLVPHRVHVRRLHGLHDLLSVGIDVRYEVGGATCSVVSLFPEARFATYGALSAQATVSATGGLVAVVETLTNECPLGASLHVGVGASASLGFKMELFTPVISAGGKGAANCHFSFEKHDQPLFGRDIETWSVVALPKRRRTLRMTVVVSTTERLAFVPVRRWTDPVTLECVLADKPIRTESARKEVATSCAG